jgi:hypothetical protein
LLIEFKNQEKMPKKTKDKSKSSEKRQQKREASPAGHNTVNGAMLW